MAALFSRSKKKSDGDLLTASSSGGGGGGGLSSLTANDSNTRTERSGSVAMPAEPRPSMIAVGNLVAGHSSSTSGAERSVERSDSRLGLDSRAGNSDSRSHHRAATHTAIAQPAAAGNAANDRGDRGGEDSLSTLESSMSFPSALAPPNSTISNPNAGGAGAGTVMSASANNGNAASALPSSGGGMGN
jgi:hypothetical protein